MTYAVHAAKTNLSRLIEAAEQGEEVIIARGDKPAVRLVPIRPPRRQAGTLKGRVALTPAFFESLPPDELALWGEEDPKSGTQAG